MSWTIAGYIVGVLAVGLYCLIVLPTSGWRMWAGTGLLGVVYFVMLGTGFQALGHPKPTWVELPGQDEARLIAYQLDEGRAIYLWLSVPWTPEPVAYSLPWQEQQAAAVYGAAQAAKKSGQPVILTGVWGRSRGEFKAYARPVQPLPLKEGS